MEVEREDSQSGKPTDHKPTDQSTAVGSDESYRALAFDGDNRCRVVFSDVSDAGAPRMLLSDEVEYNYDMYISHAPNGQDAVTTMRMFLEKAQPCIRTFTALDDLNGAHGGGLTPRITDAVLNSRALVFFITDGIFQSEWCLKELRLAVESDRVVVLVRETDARHKAIEMNDIFHQAPEEFIPLLLEVIVIPWYRQPAFRDVSVQSILKAAKTEDAYSRSVRKILTAQKSVRKGLETLSRGMGPLTTAFDVIAENSWAMGSVFLVGGFARFRCRTVNAAYTFLFACSFWFCGALCCANLYFQTTPYHVFSTDMLTAYVHLPAWQSWYFWHGFVRTEGCDELMTAVMERPHTARIVKIAVRVAGFVVLFLQISMVAVVLIGFSLPGTLNYGPHAAWSGAQSLLPGGEMFTFVHYVAMWAVIPPVIAAMFASYAMFAFISLLHWLDVRNLKHMARECTNVLKNYYEKPEEDERAKLRKEGASVDECSQGSSLLSGKIEDLHKSQAHKEEEETVCKGVIDVLDALIRRVQARADHSSRAFGGLWVHLVLFSTFQVLAITNGLRSHVRDADGLDAVAYTWWWGFQDFFHLGGGIVLLSTAMTLLCAVTTALQSVSSAILELLRSSGCPLSKVGAAHGLLLARPLGMHVLCGTVYMDIPKAAGFFLVLLVHILMTAMSVANRVDYRHR